MTKRKRTIKAADLFCGAGGTSTGLRLACEEAGVRLQLFAVNHSEIAIQTHNKNHPDAEHLCANIDSVDPRKLVPSGKLDLLVASPECTHHSNARGGKPISDQSRASAWRITEWASQIRIEHILIENVKEFRTWGPLGTNGRPLKRRKGETYFAFLNALRALGYVVEDRILNAADFGDPTSRERLFIQARLGRRPINWPEPTHGPNTPSKVNGNGNGHLFDMSPRLKPHRPAREIIDWLIPSQSIFTRKRPLSPNTLARIYAGLRKFCGLPFIVPNFGEREGQQPRTHAIDRPLPAVTSHGAGALIQPFLVKYYGGADAHSVDEPLPTVTANYEHYGLAQPFIVELRGGQDARSIDAPLSTIATSGAHHAVCQPFVLVNRNNNSPKSIDEPLPTLCTGNHMYLISPFIIRYNGNHKGRNDGEKRSASIDEPIPTLDTSNRFGLVQPYIVPVNHGKNDVRSHSVDSPMPTITSVDAWGLIEPFIINSGGPEIAPRDTNQPLNTVLTRDRLGLVQPFIVAMEHGGHVRSIDKPLNTITTAKGGAHGLAQPYLIKYNGTAGAQSADDPLDTVTAKDRFGLVIPELQPGEQIALFDIRFRMLQPHELAAAMGFPRSYFFFGNREQKVKQIGNAVPVGLAKALCAAIIGGGS